VNFNSTALQLICWYFWWFLAAGLVKQIMFCFTVLTYYQRYGALLKIVRKYGFKLEGGEWFKEGFRKLLSQE